MVLACLKQIFVALVSLERLQRSSERSGTSAGTASTLKVTVAYGLRRCLFPHSPTDVLFMTAVSKLPRELQEAPSKAWEAC